MDKQTALQRFAQSRFNFRQALQNLDEKVALKVPIEGVWTAKDLIGHLSAWEILLLQPLQSLVGGGEFNPVVIQDHDGFNLIQAKCRENLTLAEVTAEADMIRSEILAVMESVTEAQSQLIYPAPWGGQETLTHLIDGLRWHEDEHTQSIHRWVLQYAQSKPSK